MTVRISIPERIVAEAKRRGIEDLESKLIEVLINELNLNPKDEAEIHLDLAVKFLQEGKKLVEEDPVQASEKLYKASEECIKALTMHLNLGDIITRVRARGRWTVTDLEKATRLISKSVGRWFREAWDAANYLHIWGFHEAILDKDAIMERMDYIERMVEETKKTIEQRG